MRMPTCLLVEVPDYAGPTFFPDDPARQQWVPIFPIDCASEDGDVTRNQFPVVLGWALTPWKAQGMTLRRVKIKLGKAVTQPGILFTALSRVRHPDNILLDDDFLTLFAILQQTKHKHFLQRMHWERLMRVKFSRTCRRYIRDTDVYSTQNVWTGDA